MEPEERFEQHNDEYLKFPRVENKRSSRPDIHGFLLLEELFPTQKNQDILAAAEHDKVWLNAGSEEELETLTDDQIIELLRCGVLCDEYGLFMFV